MKHAVVIRADASPKIGGGHVVRTFALSEMLAKAGLRTILATRPETIETLPFLLQTDMETLTLDCPPSEEIEALRSHFPLGVDALVLDHYSRGETYERESRAFAKNIVCLDDAPTRRHDCEILIDQTWGRRPKEYRDLLPERCRLLTGTKYCLLRSQFGRAREATRLEPRQKLESVLLMMGASDVEELQIGILERLLSLPNPLRVDVVGRKTERFTTSFPQGVSDKHQVKFHHNVQNMSALMLKADLGIGAAGSASWERCCLGLPTLLFILADNQIDIANALHSKGAVINLGAPTEGSLNLLKQYVIELLNHNDRLVRASEKAYEICDGLGAERVAKVIKELVRS